MRNSVTRSGSGSAFGVLVWQLHLLMLPALQAPPWAWRAAVQQYRTNKVWSLLSMVW
jgi:hypothetical protein